MGKAEPFGRSCPQGLALGWVSGGDGGRAGAVEGEWPSLPLGSGGRTAPPAPRGTPGFPKGSRARRSSRGSRCWRSRRASTRRGLGLCLLRQSGGLIAATSEHTFEMVAFMASRFLGLLVLGQPWGSFVLEFWGVRTYSCI